MYKSGILMHRLVFLIYLLDTDYHADDAVTCKVNLAVQGLIQDFKGGSGQWGDSNTICPLCNSCLSMV